MTDAQLTEVRQLVVKACDVWCPKEFKHEELTSRMMRALLNVNAYTNDANRVMAGEDPIRTCYPLPLPAKPVRSMETAKQADDRQWMELTIKG